MPNGWSIALGGMEATDPEGAAGLKGKTDNHFDRLAGAFRLPVRSGQRDYLLLRSAPPI